ncbi:MAG: enolase C-terminal domain-like protein [Alloprevotella sp.]
MKLTVEPRTLIFKQPAGTSRGVYTERRLWYVHVRSRHDSRLRGIGECAPLPDLSCDWSDSLPQTLAEACRSVEQLGCIDYERWRNYPSVLFALETALLSFRASQRGDCLRLFDNDFTRGKAGLQTNGLVWMGTKEEMAARMEEKLRAGYRCVKLKIGAIGWDEELSLLQSLRRRFPKEVVELRVDANGGFSVAEAPERLEQLARLDVHSIEQPIRQGQWDEMARLCRLSPLPIALDEELIGVNCREEKLQLLDTIRPAYIILKPSLHGGLRGAEEWMEVARERGIAYWVTSALESNVGLNAIAQWAAEQGCTDRPQGLGTGQLFVDNFPETRLSLEGDTLWAENGKTRAFLRELDAFSSEWQAPERTMTVHTSGSTGQPKAITVEKSRMEASARMTLRQLQLPPGSTALLCLPLSYIAGRMMAVRALTGGLHLVSVAPSSHPFATLNVPVDFAALTPMQVAETLKVPAERRRMEAVGQLIIGGGAIPPAVEAELRTFPHAVWSTYGMTETLSHVALRRVNVPEGAARGYVPLEGVRISLNAEGCLVVDAPNVAEAPLTTNDLARIEPDGSFFLLGRRDNTVCSGGLKLQVEPMEELLRPLVGEMALTAVPDDVFGEALTLLYTECRSEADVEALCRQMLPPTHVPKHFFRVGALPQTTSGKPARATIKSLAVQLCQKQAYEE